ncbi:conserved hypothetical protein [Theileria orientalis strain Shintoku]|uniref:Uncharacterized protein n=1 Tax=Theileria orientalis strain Shintoku TaxID=869250 RepID=J4C305_THEOR|nr:conserved hypothetical protein [Theileria orientalis strain Shintoku]PVC49579.1 hypothetical protein MACL_00002915 [Theileria orientalis]BAM39601.1 conserved hypothetical protein [Theileria orientalis strain Shintoku]|eukprot:XP_009689902.1 conserved hypothetical protein [Theileria orientalis strain Shintoku]
MVPLRLVLSVLTYCLLPFICASPNINYRYLFDKDGYYTSNTYYDKLCSKEVRNSLICMVLKISPLNYFISAAKSYLINLIELPQSECLYMDYHNRSIMTKLSPHVYVVYPFMNDSITFYNLPKVAKDQIQFFDNISLIQMKDNDDSFESCIIIVGEVCRFNVNFSSNLSLLIKGSKLNILPISTANEPFISKINYPVNQSMGFRFPSSKEFNDHISAVIINQFLSYKNDMLKKLDSSLLFRECVLMNELDILFYNINQFPLQIYNDIKKFKTFIMDGFYHITYVMYTKLQEIWKSIQNSNMDTIHAFIQKFVTAYGQYELDLYSGLKFIMDHLVYSEILKVSSLYFNSSSTQLENFSKSLTRLESSKLLSDSNEHIKKLSVILDRQCQAPSKFGPVSTTSFFKKAESAYVLL